MRILLWIVRALVVLLLVLRLVLRLLFPPAPAGGQAPPPAARVRRNALGGELVRDPQCGTYVPEGRAIAVGVGRRRRCYFCSATLPRRLGRGHAARAR